MSIVWEPTHPEQSRMWAFKRFAENKAGQRFSDYAALHQWSIKKPADFWQYLCEFFEVRFDTPPESVLKNENSMEKALWFEGATFNFTRQLLSRNDDHPALICLNESGERSVLSYKALHLAVAGCRAGLVQAGVTAGDRVAAIMPNTAYTVISMLAAASLGAVWSSCSTDFGAEAAIDRLGQIEPKLLFAVTHHGYGGKCFDDRNKIKRVIEALPSLQKVVLCPPSHSAESLPNAVSWEEFVIPDSVMRCTPLPFSHPLYILFSSGTTGKPKCIVHGAGGTFLQHIKELGLHTDIHRSDNLFFYTTCGWMMWNWMVSVLALGATLTLYEGSPVYPDASRVFQIIEEEKVTVFGTSAKFISAVEKAGVKPCERFGLQSLRTLLSTGSPLLPANYDFVYRDIKKDVQLSSISGGTDIVSCFALGNPLLPVRRGEIQAPGLGMAVAVFDEEGNSVAGTHGELVCTRPFPSMPVYFWQDEERKAYHKAYFSRFDNVWAHGDFAEITPHQGVIIHGRSDAVLNPGGVRIGTAEIYRQIENIPEILDSVVIAQNWEDDVRVVLFVKLHNGNRLDGRLKQLICDTLRHNASPRHVPDKILQVKDIPRTQSGKIVELAVRQTVQNETVLNLQSLANPEALEEFKNRAELKS